MSLIEESGHELKELEDRIRSDFDLVIPDLKFQFTTYAAWVADDPTLAAVVVEDDVVCVTGSKRLSDRDRQGRGAELLPGWHTSSKTER